MTAKVVYIRPLAVDLSTGWSPAGKSAVASVDPGDPISHDDATSYMRTGNDDGAGTPDLPLRYTGADKPNDILSVTSVKVVSRGRALDATCNLELIVGVGGAYTLSSPFAGPEPFGSWITQTSAALANPRSGSGGVWTAADIAAPDFVFGVEVDQWTTGASPGQIYDSTTLYVELTYEPIPRQDGPARDAASRSQWDRTYEAPTLEMVFAEAVDAYRFSMLDLVGISHREGPHAQNFGWRSRPWERVLHRPTERRLNLNDGTASVVFQRALTSMLRFSARTASPHPIADGLAFFSTGATINFSRASVAWVADPSGGDRLVRVDIDQPKYGGGMLPVTGSRQYGLLLESAGENDLAYSSFRDQLTGWTVGGSGVNGSAVTAEQSPLLFDAAESGYCASMLAGSPHTTDLTLTSSPTGTYPADSIVCLTMHYQSHTGATSGPGWSLQRGVDSNWYDAGAETWGASKVVNATPVSGADWTEAYETLIDVGASGTTLTLVYTIESGEPAGCYIGHSQIDDAAFPQSTIITEGVGKSRAADSFQITNNAGARSINAARGAFACIVAANWNDEESEVDRTIWNGFHDASNYIQIKRNVSFGRWEVEYMAGGVAATALKADSLPTRGREIRLGARWTSSEGELGLPVRTIDVFVDGVKGISAVASATLTEAATSNLFLLPSGGIIRDMQSVAYVPTDEEMARLPRT